MKTEKKLKKVLIILFIILISLISFGGIFVQKTKFVQNIIPQYKLGMDLTGKRKIRLAPNEIKEEVDKKEENAETQETEESAKDDENIKKENNKITKKIIEKRLKQMQSIDSSLNVKKAIDYYVFKLDEETGKIHLELPEQDNTDMIAQYVGIKGTFNIVNENEEILLDNSHIEAAQVNYENSSKGTVVFLTIQFNKEGTKILNDILNTYVTSSEEENEENNETKKTVSLKFDDTTIVSNLTENWEDEYFKKDITNGILKLSVGSASNSSSDLASYSQEAYNLAVLLNTGALPTTYSIEENRYILSEITPNTFIIPSIIVGVLLIAGVAFLIIKYRKNGILSTICLIGYIAVVLLIVRYTNVVITLEGIIGIIVSVMLNYIFTIYILNSLKQENKVFGQALIKFLFVLIPVAITIIIFCFTSWIPIYSFGMAAFWGTLLIVLYNWAITKNLF